MDNRYFQYLKGERKGEIVMFDKIEQDDGINFIAFKDGSRCNEEFILPLNETHYEDKLMAEISDPNNAWRINEEWVGREEERWELNRDQEKVCVQPFNPGKLKVVAIPPRKTIAKFGKINNTTETQKPIDNKPNLSNDPIWLMMEKAKKFDTKISMDLIISLPSKSLYNVTKESFDDGGSKIIEYIISNIDNTKLKETLKIALLSAYEDISNNENNTVVLEEPIVGKQYIENNILNG